VVQIRIVWLPVLLPKSHGWLQWLGINAALQPKLANAQSFCQRKPRQRKQVHCRTLHLKHYAPRLAWLANSPHLLALLGEGSVVTAPSNHPTASALLMFIWIPFLNRSAGLQRHFANASCVKPSGDVCLQRVVS